MSKKYGISLVLTVENDAALEDITAALITWRAEHPDRMVVLSPAFLLPEATDGEATKAD